MLDRVDREASFANLIALLVELCSLTSTTARDWQLPEGIHLRPVGPGEQRLKLGGEYILYNSEAETTVVELPISQQLFPFRVCSQVPDHGSIGASLLHFLLSRGYLFPVFFVSFLFCPLSLELHQELC